MSRKLFDHSPDLRQLRDEGYSVHVTSGHLVLRDVPYVDSGRAVRRGTLISSLNVAGEKTQTPETHVALFDGDVPCYADGRQIQGIYHSHGEVDLGGGLRRRHQFSAKPDGDGYRDYHHKMSTYAAILSAPAAQIDPTATPRVYSSPPDDGEEGIFEYTDTASGRAGIGALADRLRMERVAIVGLGGTGSYILDLLAKSPVAEIRIFDSDPFLQHNAFRAPGAAPLEALREVPQKVEYLKSIYSNIHRRIVAHSVKLDAGNVHLLDGVTFAFLSMDAGEAKKAVVDRLEAQGASFVDVGMGLDLTDGTLGGILRVTTSTPAMRQHVHAGRVSFADPGADDLYSTNIQVAELNCLNAALAVVRWKRMRGFYRDLQKEHHALFTTDCNFMANEDRS